MHLGPMVQFSKMDSLTKMVLCQNAPLGTYYSLSMAPALEDVMTPAKGTRYRKIDHLVGAEKF